MQIIELLTPAYEAAWLPWAVQYFFLIGIAATSALLAGVLAFASPGSSGARLLPTVVVVLVVSAIAAPIALVADLHQPGRFWHFYFHPAPSSWMSLGAFLLPLFLVLALGFAAGLPLLLVLGKDEGMEFVKRHDIAALFVTRENGEFISYASPVFEQLFPEQGR